MMKKYRPEELLGIKKDESEVADKVLGQTPIRSNFNAEMRISDV
jgi:hypothetical protein